jgi:hypothetical protein
VNYSVTQAGNITALIGVLSLLANAFNVNVAREEIELAVGAIASIVGLAISWYGRYRQGDLRVSGARRARVGSRRRRS